MKCKENYHYIDMIRLFACLSILLYHLNLLKGGYLAVCAFFALSGYFSCISAFQKDKFSFRSYYQNRLLKLYLPLVMIVCITVATSFLFSSNNWLNLKLETTSILFGYNNFWQLDAHLDYFARHINSPFMHFWYIAILLQFDLIFPFLYLIFRKIGDRFHKMIPCITLLFLSITGTIYFYQMSIQQTIMHTYYNTFTRIFSLLFGFLLGFFHSYYHPKIPKKFHQLQYKITFYSYLGLLLILFLLVDASSSYFALSMIIVTLITCRLIDYGTIIRKGKQSFLDKQFSKITSMSYEIYLVQYPIIYLFQFRSISIYLKLILITITVFLISYLLHLFLKTLMQKQKRIWQYVMCICILSISCYGMYQYVCTKDFTKEIKQLEEQLAQNEQMLARKQEEYKNRMQQEKENWLFVLENLENAEHNLQEQVHNIAIVGIGDSVMLGAVDALYQTFPNGYFDARISRTAWVVSGILEDLNHRGLLGDVILLNLGANGDCPESCKIEIMENCQNRHVFWVNVTNDYEVHVNQKLENLSTRYPNLHIIDWATISSGHPEYFVADGIHLTSIGKEAYTKAIIDAIYQFYLEEYQKRKSEIIKKHEETKKEKLTIYGNDLLLNAFDLFHTTFEDAQLESIQDDESLKIKLEQSIAENSLTHKVLFAFDTRADLTLEEYQCLITLCEGHELYMVVMDANVVRSLDGFNQIHIIDFSKEIKYHPEYLMVDGVHLTNEGNQALLQAIKNFIK